MKSLGAMLAEPGAPSALSVEDKGYLNVPILQADVASAADSKQSTQLVDEWPSQGGHREQFLHDASETKERINTGICDLLKVSSESIVTAYLCLGPRSVGASKLFLVEPIHVLIVDDESLVRHALRIFVDSDAGMRVVGEAEDGEQAIDLVELLRPDVVLMDLRMPKMSGIEATKSITSLCPETRILAVTTFSSERHVVPALRAGASGYLVKDTEPDDIVDAIREVHAGRSVLSPRLTQELILSLRKDHDSGPRSAGLVPQELTERELSVVRLIAQGMSNAEIAQNLYLSEPTIKSNLSGVMTKWGVRDRVQVLIYAVQHNIVRLESLAAHMASDPDAAEWETVFEPERTAGPL